MSGDDFIETYADALPRDACAKLIQRFDADGSASRGVTAGGLDVTHKNSWDIGLSGKPQWADAEQMLNVAMLSCLLQYVRKYAYVVLGPHWLNMLDPATGQKRPLDADTLSGLPDDTLRAVVTKAFRPGVVNLQKYLADEGGYPRWHCELGPKADRGESLHRSLLWTLYLNEGFGEGETEFYYQRRKFVPGTGTLLIAPAAFTHTHRGNMPKGGDKYIATSWILFQRAEPM
jgi:hypothetical protein